MTRTDSNHREVDLIAEQGLRMKAIEIKAGKTIPKDFTRNLYHFQQLAGVESVALYLIYGGNTSQPRSNLTVLPWHDAVHVFDLYSQ